MSAKTSNQPGRRTPLSLSGSITKGGQSHNSKGNSGTNANGHNSNLKQDNKSQQHNKTEQQTNSQKQQQAADAKDKLLSKQSAPTAVESKIPKPQQQQSSDNSKSQKHGNQNDKKQQLAVEKQQPQNGVSNNHKISSSQQQQQNNKEKQQNDNDIKSIDKDNKKSEAIQEKYENEEKEKNKTHERTEKDDKKHKVDKKKQELKKDEENKKEDNKKEDSKKEDSKKEDSKKEENKNEENKKEENKKEEDKIEIDQKKEGNIGTETKTVNTPETESIAKDGQRDIEKNVVEQMHVVLQDIVPHQENEKQKQDTSKSAPPTPKSLKESKLPTPNKPTSTKTDKTPKKCTPTKREVTSCIDDFEMEPLNLEHSPTMTEPKEQYVAGLTPCATSTPGKIHLTNALAKTDVQLAMRPSVSPERPRAFSQISGRRAIRQSTNYTPSKFQCNPQFRESYRRINTELDATNTSLNVTVGSEIPNNASFSFFGRGRKRERTPPQLSQSVIGELKTTEMEISPPKRARLDFFSVVSSPLSLLRNRFSKATLQSSTPFKLEHKLEEKEDDIEVQNVSGATVHEDIEKTAEEASEYGDASFTDEANTDNIPIDGELEILDSGDKELQLKSADKQMSDDGDIKITETLLHPMTGDPTAKNKRCIVM